MRRSNTVQHPKTRQEPLPEPAVTGGGRRRLRRGASLTTRLLLVGVAIAILVRAYLPIWLTKYVNRTLSKIPDYSAKIEDVDLHLWAGGYTIISPALVKENGRVPEPIFSAEEVRLSVEWRQLLNGALVGEIEFIRPNVTFVQAKSKERSQTKVEESWLDRVRELFPLRLNRVEVKDGELHYKRPDAEPPVDVEIHQIGLLATNLTNSEKISEDLIAMISAAGLAEGQAPVSLEMKIDPYAEVPTFDADFKIEGLALTRLNDYFRAAGNFDVERGEASLYAEVASSGKEFNGYLKPIFKDIHLVSLEKDSENPLSLAWQGLVSAVVEIFSNQSRDQFAAEIPLSGSAEKPEIDSWSTVFSIIKNAFVEGLKPQLKRTVDIDL